jgi:hypothetical protein
MKNIFLMAVLLFVGQSAFCQSSDTKKEIKKTGADGSSPTKNSKRVFNLPTVYTFIGNGNWDEPSNWENNLIPPADIAPGSEIRINSQIPGAKCILNVPYEIPNTTNTIKLIVYTGNQFVVPDLIVK